MTIGFNSFNPKANARLATTGEIMVPYAWTKTDEQAVLSAIKKHHNAASTGQIAKALNRSIPDTSRFLQELSDRGMVRATNESGRPVWEKFELKIDQSLVLPEAGQARIQTYLVGRREMAGAIANALGLPRDEVAETCKYLMQERRLVGTLVGAALIFSLDIRGTTRQIEPDRIATVIPMSPDAKFQAELAKLRASSPEPTFRKDDRVRKHAPAPADWVALGVLGKEHRTRMETVKAFLIERELPAEMMFRVGVKGVLLFTSPAGAQAFREYRAAEKKAANTQSSSQVTLEVLREAGPNGLTYRELIETRKLTDTTLRKHVGELGDAIQFCRSGNAGDPKVLRCAEFADAPEPVSRRLRLGVPAVHRASATYAHDGDFSRYTAQILEALKEAGENGLTCDDLVEMTKAGRSTIYTQLRSLPEVERIIERPALYRHVDFAGAPIPDRKSKKRRVLNRRRMQGERFQTIILERLQAAGAPGRTFKELGKGVGDSLVYFHKVLGELISADAVHRFRQGTRADPYVYRLQEHAAAPEPDGRGKRGSLPAGVTRVADIPADWLDIWGAVQFLGWSHKKVYRMVNTGKLTATQSAGQLWFDPFSLAALAVQLDNECRIPNGWVQVTALRAELELLDRSSIVSWMERKGHEVRMLRDPARQMAAYISPASADAYRQHRANTPRGLKITPQIEAEIRALVPVLPAGQSRRSNGELDFITDRYGISRASIKLLLRREPSPESLACTVDPLIHLKPIPPMLPSAIPAQQTKPAENTGATVPERLQPLPYSQSDMGDLENSTEQAVSKRPVMITLALEEELRAALPPAERRKPGKTAEVAARYGLTIKQVRGVLSRIPVTSEAV